MPAARQYQQKPRHIAEQVVKALPDGSLFAEVEVAGPGFINIRLADDFLARHVMAMSEDARAGCPQATHPQTIVLDFGGPNVAKYLHVGHLRSSIIGDSLQRLFRVSALVAKMRKPSRCSLTQVIAKGELKAVLSGSCQSPRPAD